MHQFHRLTRSMRFTALGASVFAATSLATATSQAIPIHVDSNCTIEQAFETLNSQSPAGGCEVGTGTGDIIQLEGTTYFVSERLGVYYPATIRGHSSGTTRIVADDLGWNELFFVSNGSWSMVVTFENLALEGAWQPLQTSGIYALGSDYSLSVELSLVSVSGFSWSGIYAVDANVRVTDSNIVSNSTPGSGGGIYCLQTDLESSENVGLNIDRSAIAFNSAQSHGGGIFSEVAGNSNLRTSTVSTNSAGGDGGGMFLNNRFYFNIDRSTIASNFASYRGGGIAIYNAASYVFGGSIIADNDADTGKDGYTLLQGQASANLFDTLVEQPADFNVNFNYSGADLRNVDPNLDAWPMDVGGVAHTWVQRLLPGSPALDYAGTGEGVDQRGFPAPRDGDGNGSKLLDLGAYEHDRNWQTELLWLAQTSDAHELVSTTTGDTSTTFSNKQGTRLNANATGDFVTYRVPEPHAGNYNVRVRVRKGTNRGRFQLQWSTSASGPWTSIGGTQDLYASTTQFQELNLTPTTPVNIGSWGHKFFRFLVDGQNTQSSGHQLVLDTIRLTPG